MESVNTLDRKTGKPRLMGDMCATCVFRPGNPMDLRPGRLRQLIHENTGPDAHGLVCHETLSYGQHPELGHAFCRGFFDRFGHLSNYLRICMRFGGFTEVRPPITCQFCNHPIAPEGAGGVGWQATTENYPYPVLFCPGNPGFPVHEPEDKPS
jgi:hypothetical protein